MGDQNAAHTHPTPPLTGPSFVRTFHMSEEDRTGDCSHMILAPVGLQSFLLLHRRSRSSRARATPASDTIRGQRRRSPTDPDLATSRQPSQHCAGASYPCLGHISWPEVAFPNAFSFVNVSVLIDNTALELPLPRTHCVARGGNPQRIFICKASAAIFNTALELPLPMIPSVARGGIHQRIIT